MVLTSSAGMFGYLSVAVSYLLLTLAFLTGRRPDTRKALLVAAALASALWGAVMASSLGGNSGLFARELSGAVRDFAWLAFLAWLVLEQMQQAGMRLPQRSVWWALGSLMAALLATDIWLGMSLGAPGSDDLRHVIRLIVAIVGLILVEQVYRNTPPESRRAIKYLCIGIGGLFAYDFYLFADALMMQRIDPSLWDSRGYVNVMVVPLLALAVARDPGWSNAVYVSRKVAFHTAALLGAGIYLLAMGIGGYYVRRYGGSWGSVFQVVFLFGAILLLGVLLFSGAMRARVRVLINKHFFHYKYDYRDEWLRFTSTLSGADFGDEDFYARGARAMADLINSEGAALWLRQDEGDFAAIASWGAVLSEGGREPADSSLIRFLERDHWVVNLHEYEHEPELYKNLVMPEWAWRIKGAWLIAPLMLGERLFGFVVLLEAPGTRHFNWEDCDLLKTAGRQAAAFLAQHEASRALTQARQFEACNRLSTYVVHDLKNIIGQLSLLQTNAERFGHKPGFWEDALRTVRFSVDKMNGLLLHLRSGAAEIGRREAVNLCPVLEEIAEFMANARPAPQVDCQADCLRVLSQRDRLVAVIGHLVRNAQEATPDHGQIILRLFRAGDNAVVEIQDSGCGMSEEFIRNRLFQPFDTTKGEQGMGIGVFETREFIKAEGGAVEVISRPGEGTSFRLRLPLYDETCADTPVTAEEPKEVVDDARRAETAGR